MHEKLNLYICRRYIHEDNEDWWGALIIVAQNWGEAFKIFQENESWLSPKPPEKIEGVFDNGTSRVIFDYSMDKGPDSPSLEDIYNDITPLLV